jgi:hypothetical protein
VGGEKIHRRAYTAQCVISIDVSSKYLLVFREEQKRIDQLTGKDGFGFLRIVAYAEAGKKLKRENNRIKNRI